MRDGVVVLWGFEKHGYSAEYVARGYVGWVEGGEPLGVLKTGDARGETLQLGGLRCAVEAKAGQDRCVDDLGDLREDGVGDGGAKGMAN